MADLEGKSLDRYQLQQLMGRGGMADVYLAYDPHFERDVAVKVFKREDEDLLRRFIREAQLMASLSNAHLMPVYDSGMSRIDGLNVYYIVMPFMEDGTLRNRIRRSPLPLKVASRYLLDIADALDYMHRQGIIHRDIKASNVLLDRDGHCYLADFGIARTSTESTQMTSTGNVLGTVDYIAPELFETDTKANERTDYYSLGVLLYEMVTGHLPFVAESPIAVVAMHVNKRPPSPRQFVPNLPLPVERVMLRALEKRPELRYSSATELAQAFARAISARPVEDVALANSARDQRFSAPVPAYTNPQLQRVEPQTASRQTPTVSQRSTRKFPAVSGSYPVAYPQSSEQFYPGAAQPVRKTNQAGRAQGRILVLLTVLALIAVIVPLAYALIKSSSGLPLVPTATPDTQATAQAQTDTANQQAKNATATAGANATATSQAAATATQQVKNATATVIARATATAVANATATPGVIQTAVAGSPVYRDPLNNKNLAATQAAQWDQNSSCSFQDDGYHVSTNFLNSFNGCHEAGKTFKNFAAQIDMSIQKGHSGGLFFRMTTNALGAYSGYLFEVDDQGKYKISTSDDYSAGSSTPLQDWTSSSAIKTGTTKNTLQVIAKDSTLFFYVNGTFLNQYTDQSHASGELGLLATSTSGERADVVYSNLDVYPA